MSAFNNFLQRGIIFFNLPLTDLPAQLECFFTLLPAKPGTYPGPGPAGFHQIEPAAPRHLAGGGEDFYNISCLQLVLEGNLAAVDPCSDAAVTDFCVDGRGKIERTTPQGKLPHLASRSKRVNLGII